MCKNKVIEIYTIQMGKWRKAKDLSIPILDITVKSGEQAFSPTKEALYEYKAGKMSDERYTELYYKHMRESLARNRAIWKQLLTYETIALACYCTPGDFCHRLLFADIMKKYCEFNGVSVILQGEIE